MRSTHIFLLFAIVVMTSPNGLSQTFTWAREMSGTVAGKAISTNAAGVSYVVGVFSGTATFGSTTMTSYGASDIFIAKYDDTGNVLWVKNAGGLLSDEGSGISTDANGNIYITGFFMGSATFGTSTVTSYGASDIFIAKYDNAGNCLWVQKAGGRIWEKGFALSTDANGNSYLTGSFEDTTSFTSTKLVSAGSYDICIVKYNSTGNCEWASKAGGTSSDEGYAISVDGNGNSYVTGVFKGTAKFGTTTLTSYSADYGDVFIAKYDKTGNPVWAQKAGSIWDDSGYGISVDAAGNCYVTGSFSGTATFGTTTITSLGSTDIFLAKYDNAGNHLWVKQAGYASSYVFAYAYALSRDANDNYYITGNFKGSLKFGATTLSSFGGQDVFIAKYDNSGNVLWAKQAGGMANDIGYGISAPGNGFEYVTGIHSVNANFGSSKMANSGSFLAKTSSASTGIENKPEEPSGYMLSQNYPNPFNPSTVITYQLAKSNFVSLKLFNILGENVFSLINEYQQAGQYKYHLSTARYELPGGVYFYQLRSGEFTKTMKLLLVK